MVLFKNTFFERGSSDVAVGLYHPRTSVHNRSGDLSPQERGGIVSSLGTFPKVIQRPRSSRMKRDCNIPGHPSKSDSVASVLENEEGLYHPGTSVQNRSGDFGLRECGGIASSLNFGSKCIWRSLPP